MPNTDKIIFLPQLQRYDQKIKGWADNKFLTKADTPSLPKATATTLGGVKVGNGLNVTDDGILSAKTHGSETSITTSITATRDNTGTWNAVCEDTYNVIVSWFDNYDRVFAWVNSGENSLRPFPEVFVELIKKEEGLIVSTTFTIQYVVPSNNPRVRIGMTTTSLCHIYFDANGSIGFQEDYSNVDQYADATEFTNTVNEDISMLALKDGGITSAKIANSAITAAKLASGAVTADKIADGVITANKIADGVIDAATDVRVNGKSITADGVADIPVAKDNDLDSSNNTYGVVKSRGSAYGIFFHRDGVCTAPAASHEIDSRKNQFKPIPPAMIDYAVKAAMCDGKGAAYTDAEKLAARERLGIGKYELIEEIIVGENTSAIIREATPSQKPYSFGRLVIDFDANGVSSSTQIRMYPFINNVNISESVAVFSGDRNSKARIFVDVSCGIIDAQCVRQSFNSTAISAMERLMQNKKMLLSEKISSIKLQCQGSSTLPVGAVVTIYGVWA